MGTTYTTYDEVGVKEDVSDIITNITPTKTPFLASLRSEKIHQKVFQWQEDTLAAQGANAAVEGADATFLTASPTTMRSNNTQILTKAIVVAGSTDATLAYGRAKETAYQMSKRMAEIKRDLEYALIGVQQAAVLGNDATARQMCSAWNMIGPSGGAPGNNVGANINDASAAALTEAQVLTVLQTLYAQGGEASVSLVKPADSLIFAGFATATGRSRQFIDGEKKVTNVVNVYESPFGDIKVVMDRFTLPTGTFFYDPEYWRLLVFRNWFRKSLAETGDAKKQQIIGEFSLKHNNFGASGSVTNTL